MTGRGDEPIDLRLVPAAAAVWAVAAGAVLLSETGARAGGVVVGALAVLIGVVLGARAWAAGTGRGTGTGTGIGAGTAGGQVVLVLGAVAVLLLTTSVQVRGREAGDLRALAEEGARVRLVGTVRSTPQTLGGSASDERGGADGAAASGGGTVRFLVAAHGVEVVAGGRGVDGSTRPSGGRDTDAEGTDRVLGPGEPTSAAVEVYATGASATLAYGTEIEVIARLASARDPARRPVVRARAVSDPTIRAGPPLVFRATEHLRSGLTGTASTVPGDAGRLLPAVAVGDTRGVGDLDEAMRMSGLAHLTAVSGAHFSLLGAVALALAARGRVPRRWRWLPVTGVMLGFVALVHPGASVVRAAAMGAVGVLGLVAGRPARSVPALAAAVLVLLVIDPWLARDIGFVLSVVATAGIALLAAPLAAGAARSTPGAAGSSAGEVSPLALALAVPVAAQAVCAPVVLLLSPTVPVYAIPANIAAAPAVGPATIAGLLAALLGPLWQTGATWCAQVAGAACWWIAAVARTATGLPGAQVEWAAGALGPVLLACASGAALVLVLRCRRGMAP